MKATHMQKGLKKTNSTELIIVFVMKNICKLNYVAQN